MSNLKWLSMFMTFKKKMGIQGISCYFAYYIIVLIKLGILKLNAKWSITTKSMPTTEDNMLEAYNRVVYVKYYFKQKWREKSI